MSQVNTEGISRGPMAECTAAQIADALTGSFEGYVMPVNMSAQGYEYRFRSENVDPFASCVYLLISAQTPKARILAALCNQG